jgi:hypothetical protein
MSKLISYLGDNELKVRFVDEIRRHQEADQILQGTYGEGTGKNWKGCAVGCSVHSLNKINKTKASTSDHTVYEKALGMPEWLARLEDTIFEGLPKELAMKWPLRFAQAVPVGVDLDPIKWKFCAYLMVQNIEQVLTLDITDKLKEQVVSAIRGVLNLHETIIKTGKPAKSEAWAAAGAAARSAESAEWAAESAAESAAELAARSAWAAARSAGAAEWAAMAAAELAAELAARSAGAAAWAAMAAAELAAESAELAARSAADSVAWSVSLSEARVARYIAQADKLIELLQGA